MAARFAWVLNLDADLELARGRGYSPRRSVEEGSRAWSARIASTLLGEDDVLLEDLPNEDARGLVGRAFCPTPRAVARLERAGAAPEPHPPFEVLRRVASRAFSASLGSTLPGAAFLGDVDAALAKLETAPPLARDWRIKRAFGMAGRGQRVVTPGARAEADVALVRASIEEGGVQIEPQVDIETEYAIHGYVARGGAPTYGALVRQRCDAHGAWVETERVDSPGAAEEAIAEALAAEAERVASALAREGYFGPFGVDAFTYHEGGALHLQPRSEINARYTMGFGVGYGRPPEPS